MFNPTKMSVSILFVSIISLSVYADTTKSVLYKFKIGDLVEIQETVNKSFKVKIIKAIKIAALSAKGVDLYKPKKGSKPNFIKLNKNGTRKARIKILEVKNNKPIKVEAILIHHFVKIMMTENGKISNPEKNTKVSVKKPIILTVQGGKVNFSRKDGKPASLKDKELVFGFYYSLITSDIYRASKNRLKTGEKWDDTNSFLKFNSSKKSDYVSLKAEAQTTRVYVNGTVNNASITKHYYFSTEKTTPSKEKIYSGLSKNLARREKHDWKFESTIPISGNNPSMVVRGERTLKSTSVRKISTMLTELIQKSEQYGKEKFLLKIRYLASGK